MNPGRWRPAYVGLGSNLDDPAGQLVSAMAEIERIEGVRLVLRSSLYRSAPVGPAGQPDYVNAVVALLCRLSADELLAALQAIEHAHGRHRASERWGPRTLDLDLLSFAAERRVDAALQLPHPRIAQRNFVLLPWAEIAPHVDIPGLGRVASLATAVSRDDPRIELLD